ncbi:hypothetical protein [Nitratifractor sp.]|uniref:hypothetical protein n=1 Tax=Nitratifractor sp. TaxID=2268144 RepID=UPI0025EBA80B|nr:hypothetical protein [Nitratifractor sp.]
MKKTQWSLWIISWGIAGILGGCASSVPCSPDAIRAGHVCYGGHDFGQNTDPDYRQGVQDGCETGKGYFRKNYALARRSALYAQGWIKGRTVCRPADWSDSPTYSYHPLPDGKVHHTPRHSDSKERHSSLTPPQENENSPLLLAFPEEHDSQSSSATDTPEVIRYPE